MFEVEVTPEAEDDLASFEKFEQVLIFKSLVQLGEQPDVEVRNRKRLKPNDLSQWELRLGRYRIFYDLDVEAHLVRVKAIGWKRHNRLYIRGKEYNDL